MKNLKIKILAEDIYENCYIDMHNCAMTRALQRAGIAGYDNVKYIADTTGKIGNANITDYRKMLSMYQYIDPEGIYSLQSNEELVSIPPEDFEMEISLL
jgi:hypothetical protein